MKEETFSLCARLNSFRFAIKGVIAFFRYEHNARIHLVASLAVLIGSVCCRVTGIELVALIIVTGLVWVTEILNTAIERIMDFIAPGSDYKVAVIKDLAAAAVLVAAILAVITGLIVFIPKIF